MSYNNREKKWRFIVPYNQKPILVLMYHQVSSHKVIAKRGERQAASLYTLYP